MKKDWTLLKENLEYKDKVLSIRHEEYHYAKVDDKMVFTVLDINSWAVIVPVAENGDFFIVKQFRVGNKEDTLEFPGGSIDAGEPPESAAVRELCEETGAVAEEFISLSIIDPNPAFMTNKCYVYLAKNAKIDGKQSLDKFEDAEVLRVSPAQMKELIAKGEFRQSISLAAYGIYLNYIDGK